MPCNSDYMAASEREIVASEVESFIDEVEGLGLDLSHLQGYHPRVYNMAYNKAKLDERTAVLCSMMRKLKPTDYSLELQIWWRNHQKADALRKQTEADKKRIKQTRKNALAKLTKAEREVLGL